jgi:hypothetical protein
MRRTDKMELAKMTGMTPPEFTFSGRWLDWPPIMRRPTMRRALWMGMRRSERSTKTMNATTAIIIASKSSNCHDGERAPGVGLDLLIQLAHTARQAGHDAGEDQQAHAVADAAIGNLLAQPHDERRARGQRE